MLNAPITPAKHTCSPSGKESNQPREPSLVGHNKSFLFFAAFFLDASTDEYVSVLFVSTSVLLELPPQPLNIVAIPNTKAIHPILLFIFCPPL